MVRALVLVVMAGLLAGLNWAAPITQDQLAMNLAPSQSEQPLEETISFLEEKEQDLTVPRIGVSVRRGGSQRLVELGSSDRQQIGLMLDAARDGGLRRINHHGATSPLRPDQERLMATMMSYQKRIQILATRLTKRDPSRSRKDRHAMMRLIQSLDERAEKVGKVLDGGALSEKDTLPLTMPRSVALLTAPQGPQGKSVKKGSEVTSTHLGEGLDSMNLRNVTNISASVCNGVTAPTHGGVGDCMGSLNSGSTCRFTCENGYAISGETSCTNGTLTEAICNAAATCTGTPMHSSTTVAVTTCLLNEASPAMPGGTKCATDDTGCIFHPSFGSEDPRCDGIPSFGPEPCTLNEAVEAVEAGTKCATDDPGCIFTPAAAPDSVLQPHAGLIITNMTIQVPSLREMVGEDDDFNNATLHAVTATHQILNNSSNTTTAGGSNASYTSGGSNAPYTSGDSNAASSTFIPFHLRASTSCDASLPPANGAVGTCTDYLEDGASCVITCDQGYFTIGVTQCNSGKLEQAKCSDGSCSGAGCTTADDASVSTATNAAATSPTASPAVVPTSGNFYAVMDSCHAPDEPQGTRQEYFMNGDLSSYSGKMIPLGATGKDISVKCCKSDILGSVGNDLQCVQTRENPRKGNTADCLGSGKTYKDAAYACTSAGTGFGLCTKAQLRSGKCCAAKGATCNTDDRYTWIQGVPTYKVCSSVGAKSKITAVLPWLTSGFDYMPVGTTSQQIATICCKGENIPAYCTGTDGAGAPCEVNEDLTACTASTGNCTFVPSKLVQVSSKQKNGICLGTNLKYTDAAAKCQDIGMRMCTTTELASNVACDKGCNYDNMYAWANQQNVTKSLP